MLNKLLSKLKPASNASHSPTETAMLATLASPEKTAQLIAQLTAARDAEQDYHGNPRRGLLSEKLKHLGVVAMRHHLDAERQRVLDVTKRDQASAEKALRSANEDQATALRELASHEDKRQAVVNRLAPLEAELSALQQTLVQFAQEAQIEFEAAIAQDNADAERKAAAKLFEAQQNFDSTAVLTGPLGLRIAALRSEIDAHNAIVVSRQSAADQAVQAHLVAQAELALLDYDRQAQALFEVFLVQGAAAEAAQGVDKNGLPIQAVANRIAEFEAQISSPERIVFGDAITAYNNRHLPYGLTQQIFKALMFKPDLKLLLARLEDLPEAPLAPPESTEFRAPIQADQPA